MLNLLNLHTSKQPCQKWDWNYILPGMYKVYTPRPVVSVLYVGGQAIILGGYRGELLPSGLGGPGVLYPEKIFEIGGAETRFSGI